jgi:cyclophilin family peptidyl-prolyl cis-trans isomerase
MLRRLIGAVAATSALAACALAGPDSTTTTPANETAAPAAVQAPAAPDTATSAAPAKPAPKPADVAVLETVMGTIVIKMHPEDAPRTVANFKKLVRQKFYDGTYFHRVIPRFMIQGGDPNTKNADLADDGMGGPGYTVPAEIKGKHLRGSVATARLGDQANPKKDSSGSQFFIDVAPQPSLDRGGYTVFGEVISGMDVVDKIVALGSDPSTPRGPAGPNPGKKTLIKRATLEPITKWDKATAAESAPAPEGSK